MRVLLLFSLNNKINLTKLRDNLTSRNSSERWLVRSFERHFILDSTYLNPRICQSCNYTMLLVSHNEKKGNKKAYKLKPFQ